MSFWGRDKTYRNEPIEVPANCEDCERELEHYRSSLKSLEKEHEELLKYVENIKPKEIIVPAGEIDERMYDLTKDLYHWYWFQSRGLEDTIRNDKFAEKLNNMHRYVSSIKTSEE